VHFRALVPLLAATSLAAVVVGCAGGDGVEGDLGIIDSPTHQADELRQEDEQDDERAGGREEATHEDVRSGGGRRR
jgi:hypothetical protein